jgi:hypothetical protein
MIVRKVTALTALALLLAPALALAIVIADEIRVPVKVTDLYGKTVEQEIVVGLFHESSAPRPYPLLVLNHGRAATPAGFARVTVKDYGAAARWLAMNFGFLVAVPVHSCLRRLTWVFRAIAGGGIFHCHHAAACSRSRARRISARAAKDRAVMMGQSFGGATAITLAAMNPEGVQGAINFAGGGGGRPDTHPMQPCSPAALKKLFEDYGKTSRMPTLWLYSENDQYWGAKLPAGGSRPGSCGRQGWCAPCRQCR